MLDDFLDEQLVSFETKGLIRKLRNVDGQQGPRINLDGKPALNFCSNNYLGLANDSRIGQAMVDCIKEQGIGSGASRLITGNMSAHRELEKKMAEFKGSESCILFNSGYMANVGVISSLFNKDDMIFSDRLNHASIIDGIILSQAKFKRYKHCDMKDLEELLKKNFDVKKKCIITDSVFSMDGDIAPLDKIVKLAKKYSASVMIDEAHALGVIGNGGKGCAYHFGVEREIDIQMGTLSKAAGVFGAYVCGSKKLIRYLVNKARSLIYTTAMPPSVVAAAKKAIEIIEQDHKSREILIENSRYMGAQLKLMGFETVVSQTPIIPIVVKDAQIAIKFSDRLLEEGIFVSAIRPPTVPQGTSRLRLTIMSTHKKDMLDLVLKKIQLIGKELNLI